MPKVEILIVSYLKDIEWLQWCLKSIEKFAQGFNGTTVVVPKHEAQAFEKICGAVKLKAYYANTNPVLWHLEHQVMKCQADRFCPDADYVLHTDSDCIFCAPISPDDYFVDGKPVLLIEHYSKVGPAIQWKKPTEDALDRVVEYETMRRHPAVHHAPVYHELRNHVALVHRKSFTDYVLSCKHDYPYGFSEFNALGAFVVYNEFWKHRYHFIDLGKSPQAPCV